MTACERVRELVPEYLTAGPDDPVRNEVADHLARCGACRAELEEVAAMWSRLGLLPAEQPSGRLREGFYAMLEAEKARLDAAAARVEARPARAGWGRRLLAACSFRRPAFAAAFSLAVLALGAAAGWGLRSRSGLPGSAAGLRREVDAMRQTVARTLIGQDDSAADRLQGVSYSTRVESPDAATLQTLVRALETDPSVNVRLAAVDALYLFRDKPGIRDSLVRNVTSQPSPLVKAALIDLLVEIRETRAAEALKALLGDKTVPAPVQEHAKQGLEVLL